MDGGRREFPAKLLASSFASAVQFTAAFAPFPWISPAVAVLAGILQICQDVAANKQAIRQLGHRSEFMLISLTDNSPKLPEGKLQDSVQACVMTLTEIQNRMFAWSKLKGLNAFLMHDAITKGIREGHELITDCSSNFVLTSHLEIHHWQTEFERCQKADHEEILQYLADIKHEQEMTQTSIVNQGHQLSQLMDMMQQYMGHVPVGDWRHNGLQSNLYAISQTSGKLLPEMDLHAGEVRRTSNYAVGGSPAFDIWEGQYLGKEKVAIKVIRGIDVTPDTRRRFQREVQIWRKVWEFDRGNYIIPFYGMCTNDGPHPYMVSPWMDHGDALSYVKKYPSVDRKHLIRRIAEGIRLLHTQNPPIAHGDLKAINILINNLGNPLLADFGLSKMMEDITGVPFTQSRGISESYRWFAPELCCSPGIISLGSDIFSFAMTILELITGEQPFSHIRRTPEVLVKMQMGERPRRPTGPVFVERGLDDKLWNLLNRCWVAEAAERPSIHDVLMELD